MKPTLKDFIRTMSTDELTNLMFFVIEVLNEKKARERGVENDKEKEKL